MYQFDICSYFWISEIESQNQQPLELVGQAKFGGLPLVCDCLNQHWSSQHSSSQRASSQPAIVLREAIKSKKR